MKIKRLISCILCFSLVFNSISMAFAEGKLDDKASPSETSFSLATQSEADLDEDGFASTFEEVTEKTEEEKANQNNDQDSIDASTPSDAEEKEKDNPDIASSSNTTENEDDEIVANITEATDDEETVATESDIDSTTNEIVITNTATVSELHENFFGGDGKTITGVSILNPPNKITYLPANTTSINLSGLVLRYTLEDTNGVETYEDVSYGYPFNDWHYGSNHWLENPSTLGKHTINVSYIGLFGHENYSSGFSVDIDLYVREITSITILDPPTKTNYKGGEKLEMSGLTVRVNYSDGYHEDFENAHNNNSFTFKLISKREGWDLDNVKNGQFLLPTDAALEVKMTDFTAQVPLNISGEFIRWDLAQCIYEDKTLTVLSNRTLQENQHDISSAWPTGPSYDDLYREIYAEVEKIVFDGGVKINKSSYSIGGVSQKVFAARMQGMTNLKEVYFNNVVLNEEIDSLFSLFFNCSSLEKVDLKPILNKVTIKYMQQTFTNCKSLKNLNFSYGSASVVSFKSAFNGVTVNGNLDLSSLYVNGYNYDTGNTDPVDLQSMFANAKINGTLILSNFYASNPNCDTTNMFSGAEFNAIKLHRGNDFRYCGYSALPEVSWECLETGEIFDTTEEMFNFNINGYEVYYTYQITNKITNVHILNAPTKNTYNIGDTFDLTGLKIRASYDDGSTSDIEYSNINSNLFKVSGTLGNKITKVAEEKYYYIYYKDKKSDNDFLLNINNDPDLTNVSNLTVVMSYTNRPDGLNKWNLGDTFVEGLKMTAPVIYFKNGSTTMSFLTYLFGKLDDDTYEMTNYNRTHGIDLPDGVIAPGTYSFDGYYKNLYFKINTTVHSDGNVDFEEDSYGLLNNIEVVNNPTKLYYNINERFDPSGLILKLNNTNNCSKNIEYNDRTKKYFSFSPSLNEALNTNVDHITITYYNKTVDLPINVIDPSAVNRNVTFRLGHGIADTIVQVSNGAKVLKPADPNIEGYTFDYWYKDDINTAYNFNTETITGDIILTAKCNVNTYNIKYYIYGSRYDNTETDTRSYEEEKTLKTNNSWGGYTFQGWYENADYTGSAVVSIPIHTVGDKTYYAKWEGDTYDFTWNLRGGTWKNGTPPYTSHTYGSDTPLLPKADDIVYEGHSLRAWLRVDPDTVGGYDQRYEIRNYGSPLNISWSAFNTWTGDTLYAVYYDAYKVTFDTKYYENETAAGTDIGVATIEPVIVVNNSENSSGAYEDKITRPTNPTAEGYKFIGWYKDKAFTDDWDFANDGVATNITLYAKWNVIPTQKFTFDANGHGTAPSDVYVAEGDRLTNPGKLPNVTGYTFKYWYEANEDTPFDFNAIINPATATDRMLYAKWETNKYIISYNLNSGSFEATYNGTEPTEILYDSTGITLPIAANLKKTGNDFAGWYKDRDLTDGPYTVASIDPANPKDLRFYAKWTPRPYTITYYNVTNDDYVASYTPVTERNYGDIVTLPTANDMHRDGYIFKGWYDNSGFNGEIKTIVAGNDTNDKEFWAKWLASYTVTYDVSFYGTNIDATAPNSYSVEANSKLTKPSDPTRTNAEYKFDGWYKEATCTNPWNFSTDTVNENKTLYAKWKVRVLFDNGEGVTSYYKNYNENITLPDINKIGYTFDGWFNESTFNNKIGDGGDTYTVTGPKRLYGKVNVLTYQLTLNDGGHGTLTVLSPMTIYGYEHVPNPGPLANIVGWTFKHWYKEGTNENTPYQFNEYPTAPITLIAKWEENKYKVIYELNGGHFINGYTAPNERLYTQSLSLPENSKVEKTGHHFVGWFYDMMTNNSITSVDAYTAGERKVFAKWERNTYNVTLHYDGGKITVGKNITSYQYGLGEALPYLEKDGYFFLGWYTRADFSDSPNSSIGFTDMGDKEFFAKFGKRYVIKYGAGSSGGSGEDIPDQEFAEGEEITLAENTFTRSGYIFSGWQDQDGNIYGAGEKVSGFSKSLTLTAVWSKSGGGSRGGGGGGGGGGRAAAGQPANLPNGTPLTANTEKKLTTSINTVPVKQAAKETTTWAADASGKWHISMPTASGQIEEVKNSFVSLNNVNLVNGQAVASVDTYYFDETGSMFTGWLIDSANTKYYFEPAATADQGKMAIGWKQISGSWYYFNPTGTLLVNGMTPDGAIVGADGKWMQ